MKLVYALGAAVIILTTTCLYVAETTAKAKDTAILQGAYMLMGGEKDGEKISAERIQGSTVRITESSITSFDKDQKETYVVNYTLDMSQKPWMITMTSTVAPVKGEVARGLIEKNGDTVKLIYAVRGGDAPDNFTTKDKQLMFVMKKLG